MTGIWESREVVTIRPLRKWCHMDQVNSSDDPLTCIYGGGWVYYIGSTTTSLKIHYLLLSGNLVLRYNYIPGVEWILEYKMNNAQRKKKGLGHQKKVESKAYDLAYGEKQVLLLSLIGIILRWGFLIWELIFIYSGLFVLILDDFIVFFFLCWFFFHYVSAKFHLWPSSGDLPRPQIGMMSLVTISPVITAFHSCCNRQ